MTIGTWVCLRCATRYQAWRPLCARCWESRTIVDVGERRPAAVDHEPEVLSAVELARMTWQWVESKRYPELRIGRGTFMLVTGRRGHGKSTFVSGLLDGVPAAVLYVSIEEPPGPSLAQRMLRVGVKRADFGIIGQASIDDVVALARQSKAVALAIDSVQRAAFTPREIRHLLAVVSSLALVVGISQVNRDGDPRGGEEYSHECDVLVDVADMKWRILKSRFQESAAGEVLLAPTRQIPPPTEAA